jgi:hypothetical protein
VKPNTRPQDSGVAEGTRQVLYLYGIVRQGPTLPDGTGAELRAVPYDKLAAIVEQVPASVFSPEALEEKLQSVEWVAQTARRHESILETARRYGPVIPARMCTLFSDISAVETSLIKSEDWFQNLLQVFRGRHEWGLKVYCDQKILHAQVAAIDLDAMSLDEQAKNASPGQAYVLTRKHDARVAEASDAWIDDSIDEIVGVVESSAFDLRSRPLLGEDVTGRNDTMVFNLAVLVDEAAQDTFQTAIDNLAARFGAYGFGLELSGPWPPYGFCDQEQRTEYERRGGSLSEKDG